MLLIKIRQLWNRRGLMPKKKEPAPSPTSSVVISTDTDEDLRKMAETRLNRRMISVRNNSRNSPVDYLSVDSEARRMFPAFTRKPWFDTFIAKFCQDRGVAVPYRLKQ